ncbi:MAG: hypothetical protein H0X24_14705 [Ktedonobacterales bacterium]|nr:hypothetical protein [Ktedonobacterales bacterium]
MIQYASYLTIRTIGIRMNPTEPRYPRNPPQPAISTQTPSRPNPPMPPQGPGVPRTPTYAPNQRLSQPARPIERPSRPQSYPAQAAAPLPPTMKLRRRSSPLRRLGMALVCLLILVTATGLVIEGYIITTGMTPLGR